MNLTKFNDIVVAPFNPTTQKAGRLSDYPLFVMDSGEDLSAETIQSLMDAKLTDLMPFEGIRIYDRMDDGARINEWLLAVESRKKAEDITVLAVCHSVTDKQTGIKRISPGNSGVSFMVHNRLAAKRAFFINGNPIKTEDYPDRQAIDCYDNAARHVLFSFFANLMNPHLHQATVRPDKQGKSVTWMRQRTHYVFIHKNHKANKRGFVGRADCDDNSHINRMAHSRRAHDRVLRHPRYKHKVGQKIRVKSCWVGPKEWQGNSGQIYRIV